MQLALDSRSDVTSGDPPATFAALLKHHRRDAGLTQEELAERAGLSARAISDLERGVKRTPRRDTLSLLINALELSEAEREQFQRAVGSRAKRASKSAAAPSNVPARLTSFVGRQREMAGLRDRLLSDELRLLTLTGPAGAGKSSLAQEVAGAARDGFADGVCLVELASVSTATEVRPAILRALSERDGISYTLATDPLRYLRPKRLLLVLDNFEHVATAAPLVSELLSTCPGLTVLVTSRVTLRLSGEHAHVVEPLSLPDICVEPQPERLLRASEAVELFVQRARAASADFELQETNAPAVAEICRRLDGLPLAIELAAARVRVLSLDELLSRLDSPLELLTGGPRDAPARQRTLRNTLEWSYQLLGERERRLFARLALCASGCDLAAAAALDEPEAEDGTGAVVERLAALVDGSLLRSWEDLSGQSRFGMLDTMHVYALEQLEQSGQMETARGLHATHYLRLAERASPELMGMEQSGWYRKLEIEDANFLAALEWAQRKNDAVLGLRLSSALWRSWEARGRLDTGLRWLTTFLNMDAAVSTQLRAEALDGAGMLACATGSYTQADDFLKECLELRQATADEIGIQRTYSNLGVVAMRRGDYAEAERCYARCLTLMRRAGDERGMALGYGNLGVTKLFAGDYVAARRILAENVRRSLGLGMAQEVADSLNHLGWTALNQGELTEAHELFKASLEAAQESGNRVCAIESKRGLGSVLVARGRVKNATRLLREALQEASQSGDIRRIIRALDAYGCAASELGQQARATRLWAAAEHARAELGVIEHVSERAFHEQWRSRAPATDASTLTEEQQVMTLDAAVAYALGGAEVMSN